MFLDVSPKVFKLQRRTVPNFKAKVISYNSFYSHLQKSRLRWPLFAGFECRASRTGGGTLDLLTFLTRNEEVDRTRTWEIFVQTFLKYLYRLS